MLCPGRRGQGLCRQASGASPSPPIQLEHLSRPVSRPLRMPHERRPVAAAPVASLPRPSRPRRAWRNSVCAAGPRWSPHGGVLGHPRTSVRYATLPRSFEHRPTGGGRDWVRSPSARTRRVAPTQFPILVCSVGEPGLVDESPRGHRLCGDTPHPPRARAPKVWRTRERLASGAIDGVMSRSCHRRTSAPNAPRCSRAASARPKSEQATLWGESRCAARRAGTA